MKSRKEIPFSSLSKCGLFGLQQNGKGDLGNTNLSRLSFTFWFIPPLLCVCVQSTWIIGSLSNNKNGGRGWMPPSKITLRVIFQGHISFLNITLLWRKFLRVLDVINGMNYGSMRHGVSVCRSSNVQSQVFADSLGKEIRWLPAELLPINISKSKLMHHCLIPCKALFLCHFSMLYITL